MDSINISYGILFDEDTVFPWDADKYDDIHHWWRYANGFQPSKELFNDDGSLTNIEYSSEDFGRYNSEAEEFDKSIPPLEVDVVAVGSEERRRNVLCLSSTLTNYGAGDCDKIDPAVFSQVMEDERLLAFCEKYGIEVKGEAAWHLTSWYE